MLGCDERCHGLGDLVPPPLWRIRNGRKDVVPQAMTYECAGRGCKELAGEDVCSLPPDRPPRPRPDMFLPQPDLCMVSNAQQTSRPAGRAIDAPFANTVSVTVSGVTLAAIASVSQDQATCALGERATRE